MRCREFSKDGGGMMKEKQERDAKGAFWLHHLRECSVSGCEVGGLCARP